MTEERIRREMCEEICGDGATLLGVVSFLLIVEKHYSYFFVFSLFSHKC